MDLLLTEGDDPRFVSQVQALLSQLVTKQRPHSLYVVHLNNWFDHKWMDFAGIQLGAVGTWREARSTVIPPFVPNRVIKQTYWTGAGLLEQPAEPIHRKMSTADNRQRKISIVAPGTSFLWYSGNSKVNGRGSAMAYWAGHETEGKDGEAQLEKYFLAWTRKDDWVVQKVMGMSLEEANEMVGARI